MYCLYNSYKSSSVNGRLGDISAKFCTFSHAIYFAIHPNSALLGQLEVIPKLQIFYHINNKLVRKTLLFRDSPY